MICPVGAGTSSDPVDLPWSARSIREGKYLSEAVADDARDTDYKRNALVSRRDMTPVPLKMASYYCRTLHSLKARAAIYTIPLCVGRHGRYDDIYSYNADEGGSTYFNNFPGIFSETGFCFPHWLLL
ncbi:hypothetical protein V6N13_018598 [Hibiscus sabdariffa]|uniref:Uncharacterized protein n=1 Tax=Hibiscus sabdariffa TaxID=183260 RepID=A0ABR2ELH3_9ROSI